LRLRDTEIRVIRGHDKYSPCVILALYNRLGCGAAAARSAAGDEAAEQALEGCDEIGVADRLVKVRVLFYTLNALDPPDQRVRRCDGRLGM